MNNLKLLYQISIKINLPSDICREIGQYYEIPVAKIKIIQRRWRIKSPRLYWLRTIEEGIKINIMRRIDYHSPPDDRKDERIISHLSGFLECYKEKDDCRRIWRENPIEMLLLYHRYARYLAYRSSINKPYMWELKKIFGKSKKSCLKVTQYLRRISIRLPWCDCSYRGGCVCGTNLEILKSCNKALKLSAPQRMSKYTYS